MMEDNNQRPSGKDDAFKEVNRYKFTRFVIDSSSNIIMSDEGGD
jgi:hypothetical protein